MTEHKFGETLSQAMCRVFVVEDHALLRVNLETLIGMEDGLSSVGGAADGESALEIIPERKPDVVLIDLSLPGMDGIELMEKLLQEEPDLRCLIVSGSDMPAPPEQARAAGARGFIVKGDPAAILEAVHRVHAGEACFSSGLV
ncbi:MAG: response regulator transcription factor [Oceanipulchritudo sp.]